jgi:hypothetical protein
LFPAGWIRVPASWSALHRDTSRPASPFQELDTTKAGLSPHRIYKGRHQCRDRERDRDRRDRPPTRAGINPAPTNGSGLANVGAPYMAPVFAYGHGDRQGRGSGFSVTGISCPYSGNHRRTGRGDTSAPPAGVSFEGYSDSSVSASVSRQFLSFPRPLSCGTVTVVAQVAVLPARS